MGLPEQTQSDPRNSRNLLSCYGNNRSLTQLYHISWKWLKYSFVEKLLDHIIHGSFCHLSYNGTIWTIYQIAQSHINLDTECKLYIHVYAHILSCTISTSTFSASTSSPIFEVIDAKITGVTSWMKQSMSVVCVHIPALEIFRCTWPNSSRSFDYLPLSTRWECCNIADKWFCPSERLVQKTYWSHNNKACWNMN